MTLDFHPPMKRIILSLLLTALAAPAASLVWDDPNPPGVVASFRVWREEAAGSNAFDVTWDNATGLEVDWTCNHLLVTRY